MGLEPNNAFCSSRVVKGKEQGPAVKFPIFKVVQDKVQGGDLGRLG